MNAKTIEQFGIMVQNGHKDYVIELMKTHARTPTKAYILKALEDSKTPNEIASELKRDRAMIKRHIFELIEIGVIPSSLKEKYYDRPKPKKRDSEEQKRRTSLAQLDKKLKVMRYYSDSPKPYCKCCKEEMLEFLTIDHINNNGSQHRKQIGIASMYPWLIKNEFPPGFQVLCMNCNWGKRIKGECPHKLKRY
jgi:hypothetical protein